MLFQCPDDYPNSCLNRELQCNGRSECPSGNDERYCLRMLSMRIVRSERSFSHLEPSPAGVPIIVIVLAVLAFLALICILSTGRLEEIMNDYKLIWIILSFGLFVLSSGISGYYSSYLA